MKVRAHAAAEGSGVVAVSSQARGRAERAVRRRSPGDARRPGDEEPALATLAREAYRLLGLQSYYTAGPKEIRAWTIPIGCTAPQAAGVIHTDFEKGFIRAEVYSVDDLVAQHGPRRRSAAPASCASRARRTSSRTGTSPTSCSTCSTTAPATPLDQARALGPFDAVIDCVGGYAGGRCRALLGANGRHVMVSPHTPDEFVQLALAPFTTRTLLGRVDGAAIRPILGAVAAGQVQVRITDRFPLERAEDAHRLSQAGRATGKIVIEVGEE
jgi:hypothetical protein